MPSLGLVEGAEGGGQLVQVSAGGVGGQVLVVEVGDSGEVPLGGCDGFASLAWCSLGGVGAGEVVDAVRVVGCVPGGLLGAPAGVAAPQGRGLVTGKRWWFGELGEHGAQHRLCLRLRFGRAGLRAAAGGGAQGEVFFQVCGAGPVRPVSGVRPQHKYVLQVGVGGGPDAGGVGVVAGGGQGCGGVGVQGGDAVQQPVDWSAQVGAGSVLRVQRPPVEVVQQRAPAPTASTPPPTSPASTSSRTWA
ncbi:hypothetical protein AB0L67_31150 [Streptomyces flaveolus]|uniref:hypothetical protein n=1 Tax=Streptomyces flaveolus TaxID=67297 RepID=UPI00344360B3